MKLEDGTVVAEALQKSMEEEGARLPWIEVRYQEEEEHVQARAGGLVDDPSYQAEADNASVNGGSKTLSFKTTPATDKAFDIFGWKGGNKIFTTYQRELPGYEMFLAVGDTVANRTAKKPIAIPNGKVETVDGMQVQPLLSFTDDGAYVKVKYRVHNPKKTAQVIELCGGADVQIGSDDNAAIKQSGTGITMVEQGTGGSQFSLYSKKTFGVTPLDTLWFGFYKDRGGDNYWMNRTEGDLSAGTDSGIAFSWQNRTLAPGATTEFTLLFGVGEPVAPPEIDMEADIELAYQATEVGVKAKVKDAIDRTYKIHYSLDDGSEQVLSATEKQMGSDGITDTTVFEHGIDFIPATGVQQGIVGKIDVPSTWEENSVHKLQIWAKNNGYAMSDVKTVYILKKAGGSNVEEAKQYNLTFDGNGGSGTPPTTMVAYEGTKVTLPTTSMTRAGYSFIGWSPDEGNTRVQPGEAYTMPSVDTTLKAIWASEVFVPTPANITATYGTAIEPITLTATGGSAGVGSSGSYEFTVDPTTPLPAGFTLTGAVLSGTPTALTATSGVSVKVKVKDTVSEKEATTSFKITVGKRSVTVTAAANTTKMYDATAAITPGALTLGNVIQGDAVTASAKAAFSNASAGGDKPLTLSGITLSGANKDTYTVANTIELTGKITKRPITVKPADASKMVGTDKPAMQIEEVRSGDSALQGSDTLQSLGTPVYTYPSFEDKKGSYEINVTYAEESSNYEITCQKGTLTVGQDDPQQSVNYSVSGTPGPNNNGWYTSEIVMEPKGDTYTSFVDGSASIKVKDTEKEVELQLQNSTTGQITTMKKETYKSDTIAPTMGVADIQPKDGGVLGDIGRTLTFGHFFKKTVQVTVPLSDATSGLAKFEYKLPGKSYQEATVVQKRSKEAEAKFELPLGTDGTIQLRITDVAGNQSEMNLEKDGAEVWMVESEAPQISNYTTTAQQKNGWYKTDVELNAVVNDTKSGLNNVALTVNDKIKEMLLERPTSLVKSYEFQKLYTENGTTKIQLEAEDNATNTGTEKEITLQIDKELPKITDIKGNPTDWQNKETEITFTLTDAVSGIDPNETVKVLKNGIEEITLKKTGDTYKFTTKGNGTYTVKAWDLAGNELAEENNSIVVNKIQTEKPKPPVKEDIIGDIITPGGETEVPEEKDGWYSVGTDLEFNISNPESEGAPLTYVYKVWKEGDDSSKAEEVRLKSDGSNKPTVTGDGIWHIEIWLEDEAKNQSEETEIIIRNDATKPEATDGQENVIIRNQKEAEAEVKLTDNLSGVNESTIQVTRREEVIPTEIKKKGDAFICSFKTTKGGRYKVTSLDNAGNTNQHIVIVTELNAKVNAAPGISAKTDVDALLDAVELSQYKSGETVLVTMELKGRQEAEVSNPFREYIASLFKDKESAEAFYFDTSIMKHVTDADGNVTEDTITKTEKPVSISLEIPEHMRGNHSIGIAREHNDTCSTLSADIKDNGSMAVYETSEFSDYVLYKYAGKAKEEVKGNVPQTGDSQSDSFSYAAVLTAVSALVIMCLIAVRQPRKRRRYRKN